MGDLSTKACKLCATWLLLFFAHGIANASDFVSQPHYPNRSGEYSNLKQPGSHSNHQQVSESFVLAQASTLRSFSWSGRYDITFHYSSPVRFFIRIYEDAAGVPQTTPLHELNVAAKVSPTTTSFSGSLWFSYAIDIQPLEMGPGTYWISIVEADARSYPAGVTQWLWGHSDLRGPGATRGNDTEPWRVRSDRLRHSLTVSEANLAAIDIKPNSETNKIRLGLESNVWVAVLSNTTSLFDPLQIDLTTVRFGPGEAEPQRFHVKDNNGDGLGDMFLRFETVSTGISCLDTHASLSGRTHGGVPFSGYDLVRPSNCREVAIDIKPLSPVNRIFPASDVNIYVAVLSDVSSQFEPTSVNASTVRFGPGNAIADNSHAKDLNGDGVADLVLRFSNLATGIACEDATATLSGKTVNGEEIIGRDHVSPRECF